MEFRFSIPVKNKRFVSFQRAYTSSSTHPASYAREVLWTHFPGVKETGREANHSYLKQRLRMRGAIRPFPPHAFMVRDGDSPFYIEYAYICLAIKINIINLK